MKNTTSILTRAITMFLFLAAGFGMAAEAQNNTNPTHPHEYHHYQLVDVGTFGGPQSLLNFPAVVLRSGYLNNQGTMTGSADTSVIDPYCFWDFNCYATNGFQWKNGGTTDLGVLPGGIGSQSIGSARTG